MIQQKKKSVKPSQLDMADLHWTKLDHALTHLKHTIPTLPWPSNSPDLNPIKHVWSYLDKKVHSRKQKLWNSDQLWEVLKEEWERIDLEYIGKLYGSMRNRLDAVLSHNGGNTEY